MGKRKERTGSARVLHAMGKITELLEALPREDRQATVNWISEREWIDPHADTEPPPPSL